MRFKASTIFVTGGAGFIGSAVVRHLLHDTHARVVNIDKFTYAANLDSLPGTSENLNYAFAKQCICDGPGLRHLFEKYQPDAVINLAAESHVDRSIDGPGEFIQTNIGRYFHPPAGNVAPLAHIVARKAQGNSASFTSPPMRCSVRSAMKVSSRRPPRMRRTRRYRRAKLPPTTWCAPGAKPMNCRRWSPIARIITGLITSRRS